ncbi:MAG: hypothetical protein AABX65_00690 [Nanoarchaeota archaeon]
MAHYLVSIHEGKFYGTIIYKGSRRDEAFKLAKHKSHELPDTSIDIKECSSFDNQKGIFCEFYTLKGGEVIGAVSQTLFLEDLAMLADCFAERERKVVG